MVEIARGCGRYPRLRFIIVADHIDFPIRGNVSADLATGLSGGGGAGWPENTLLYVGASANATIGYNDPIVSRFGLVLPVTPLVGDDALKTAMQVGWGDAWRVLVGTERFVM